MILSWNWLNEIIDLKKFSLEDVSKALTDSGLEVEACESKSKVSGPVIVAKILECQKHPNADQLKLCKVESKNPSGESQIFNIVCGAPNARTGIKVSLACVGAVLPGEFKIKASKIRGESSDGMLCSAKELGISDEDEGIIELPEDTELGKSIAELHGLNDYALTLNITPNRGDCLSMIGVARDLCAKLKTTFTAKYSDKKNSLTPLSSNQVDQPKISVDPQAGCSDFYSVRMKNISPSIKTPSFILNRLDVCGMRSVSPLVDISNYVMLETGHPNHIYDTRNVHGSEFKIRLAAQGEKFILLDGKEIELQKEDTVICDGKNTVVALAGVMGGLHSEVKDDTQDILVEVAGFDAVSIRKTAKKFGIKTESSYRFERGVSRDSILNALAKVVEYIQHIAPECEVSQTASFSASQISPKTIALRLDRLRKISGLDLISEDICISILNSLGFKKIDQKQDRTLWEIPNFRPDIEREIDLIEEVTRIYGFDKIPYQYAPMTKAPHPENPVISFSENLRAVCATLGFRECISFPFSSREDLNRLNISENHPLANQVPLANPLAESESNLQNLLFPALLKALQFNRNHGTQGTKLFEVGRCFLNPILKEEKISEINSVQDYFTTQAKYFSEKAHQERRPYEKLSLAMVVDQPWEDKQWHQQSPTLADWFMMKGICENISHSLGLGAFGYEGLSEATQKLFPFLHPLRSCLIFSQDIWIGYMGELHPKVSQDWDLNYKKSAPLILQWDVEAMIDSKNQNRNKEKAKIVVEKFPVSRRDLSIVVAENITNQNILDSLLNNPAKRNLKKIELFDLFTGESLGANKKSLAYALEFHSNKRTLTDKEVDLEMQIIVDTLKKNLGAELR